LIRIGIRQHEGFGWAMINPPWLCRNPRAPIYCSERRRESPRLDKPRSWPGTDLSATDMEHVTKWARDEFSALKQNRARLIHVNTLANRARTRDEFTGFLTSLGASKHWAELVGDLNRIFGNSDLSHIRFFLEAAIAQLDKDPE
jgi:hypothetical protein